MSQSTPLEVAEASKNAVHQLLPEKSKSRYNAAYSAFNEWKLKNNVKSTSENVLLAYFNELSVKLKPSTPWSEYSMLKNTSMTDDNMQINLYPKLIAFLKLQSDGFKSKKSKILTADEIAKFLNEAPDNQYLVTKVALIFGVAGACRGGELTTVKISDIENRDGLLLINIPDTKTKISSSYTIDGEFAEIVKKYAALCLKIIDTDRFFLNYHNGKCTSQVIGKNKFANMPKVIAEYSELPEADLHTGHSFRRTSATLLADSGAMVDGNRRVSQKDTLKIQLIISTKLAI